MITVALVAMNLHEVLLGTDGRLPRVALRRKKLRDTVPQFIASTGMHDRPKQSGVYDTFYGITITYRLRTRVRALPDGFRWVPIDSRDVKSEDKHIIELVLETERP